MHESLDEFKFRPDTDTSTRVICTCASEKLLYNVVSTLAPSFLIGSSSYLQVTRTSITSRTSSKFGQIGPRTAELAALERLEKSFYYLANVRYNLDPLAPGRIITSWCLWSRPHDQNGCHVNIWPNHLKIFRIRSSMILKHGIKDSVSTKFNK